MIHFLRAWTLASGLFIFYVSFSQAADQPTTAWPPNVDPSVETKPFPGRKVEFFRHGSRAEWGYAKPQQDYFILVHPESPKPGSPLYVCLHSAGHDSKSAFEIGTEGAEGPRGHFLYYPPPDCYGLYPDCRANGGVGDWWWGGPQPNDKNPKNLGSNPTPVEKRVEETVTWIVSQYPIDQHRVYLTGISMGGSGSLGIGVPRGYLFASILVHVPAGATHIEQRIQFPLIENPAGRIKFSDPPVVVAYSGVDDGWARDQAVLIKGMHDAKYGFIDFWGHSGHDSTKRSIVSKCDLAFTFPWLEIRRNEAYPAFTNASSDSQNPWQAVAGAKADDPGQINAYFRWKSLEDQPAQLAMQLRLIKPDEISSSMPIPKESTADVTLRRLQKFYVPPSRECAWEFIRDDVVVAKGIVQPDDSGVLTVPRLTISQTPAVLNLKLR